MLPQGAALGEGDLAPLAGCGAPDPCPPSPWTTLPRHHLLCSRVWSPSLLTRSLAGVTFGILCEVSRTQWSVGISPEWSCSLTAALDHSLTLIDMSAKWTVNAFVKFTFLLIEGQEKVRDAVVSMFSTKESHLSPCRQGAWCCLRSPVHQRLSRARAWPECSSACRQQSSGCEMRGLHCLPVANQVGAISHTERAFLPLESFPLPLLGLCQSPLSLLKMLLLGNKRTVWPWLASLVSSIT